MTNKEAMAIAANLAVSIREFITDSSVFVEPNQLTDLTSEAKAFLQSVTTTLNDLSEEKIAGVVDGSKQHQRWVAGDHKFYRNEIPIN